MSKIEELLYLLKHKKSQRDIESSLNVSRNTIRKYKNIAHKYGFSTNSSSEQISAISLKVHDKVYIDAKDRDKYAQDLLEPFHNQIEELLLCKRMTNRQLHRLLKEQGLAKCSEKTLSRYIAKFFPQPQKYTVHIEDKPGMEAQVDYADVGIMFGKKTYIFVMTMSYSRCRYVEFVHSQNVESWVQSHMNAFDFFGAVPHTVVIDNLKSGVIKPDIYDPVLNKSYAELSRHYNFTIDAAKVRKPQHKGKVERRVLIARQQLLAGRFYNSLDDANAYAKKWCSEIIADVVCTTTGEKPNDLFALEKPLMLALNPVVFDICVWSKAKVNKDHHVTVNGNFYSLPTRYIGLTIDIRSGMNSIKIYLNYRLIKCHDKAVGKGIWTTDLTDYPDHIESYINSTPDNLKEKAKLIGEFTFDYISTVLKVPSKISLRKSIRILELTHKYDSSRIEAA
jgi:transposase